MIQKIVFVREDESEVEINTKPREVRVDTEDEGLVLEVTWNPVQLADDAEEYLAVRGAWPGTGKVILYDRNGQMIFKGTVSGFSQGPDEIGLKARQDSMVPGAVSLDVIEDTADVTRMSVLISANNYGKGGLAVDFGDGTPGGTNNGDGTTTTSHLFAAAGTYTVTVTDVDEPERSATYEVIVPFSTATGDLEVSISADAGDPTRRRASILADNKGAGEVTISFGDGLADETNPGDGTTNTEHTYGDGTYTVTVTDVDEPVRTVSQEVTIPFAPEG
jgi:hypothetical protein